MQDTEKGITPEVREHLLLLAKFNLEFASRRLYQAEGRLQEKGPTGEWFTRNIGMYQSEHAIAAQAVIELERMK